MDLKKIFVKNACPTKIGGQAILEGLMMKGPRSLSIAIRMPSGDIHLTVEPLPEKSRWLKIPLIRGIAAFATALIQGTSILFYSAQVLEDAMDEEGKPLYEKDRTTLWLEKRLGEKRALDLQLYSSVVLAALLTVGVFIILPTWLINLLAAGLGGDHRILLNLAEGLVRIAMFVIYVAVISRLSDIRKVFQYHGAEHKTIHCYESGLPLTPANADSFYTLHPRCGTSFLMFVMIISLLIFSLLGWPNLAVRVASRLLFIPFIAGLSYELLQFTGRRDGPLVRLFSLPGIALQRLTTKEPTPDQLEVAIAAMMAVMPQEDKASREHFPDIPADSYWVGRLDAGGQLHKDEEETAAYRAGKQARGALA